MVPVLYEDDDIVAVDKPDTISTIPERKTGVESVYSLLSADSGIRVFIVHRLDKEVSGVVLFAKNRTSHKWLNEQFEHRRVHKTYLGMAWGNIPDTSGVVDLPLRQFGSGRMGVDTINGKSSRTRYERVQNYDGCCLLRVSPVTGRRHQIRVHLYATGYPLLGDLRYGDKEPQSLFSRLMLHARSIRFQHPDGNLKVIEAPIPESFRRIQSTAERTIKNYFRENKHHP